VIGPWFLDIVRQHQGAATFAYVVLRPSEEECARRAAQRSEEPIFDYAPLHPLYQAFADLGALERCVMAEEDGGADDMAARIRAEMPTGRFLLDD